MAKAWKLPSVLSSGEYFGGVTSGDGSLVLERLRLDSMIIEASELGDGGRQCQISMHNNPRRSQRKVLKASIHRRQPG